MKDQNELLKYVVGRNDFGMVETWIFFVHYDRAKCQERVSENNIEIRLTFEFYARNGENGKTGKSCAVRRERPWVCMARAVCTLCPFWHGPHVLTELRFLRFLCFFTHFYFELAFGVNIKGLDNFVSFPMALNWLENDLWILSYDEITPSGSWRNFKET